MSDMLDTLSKEELIEQLRYALRRERINLKAKTIRDEFAKEALIGLVSVYGENRESSWLAEKAFGLADAMLAAREKKP